MLADVQEKVAIDTSTDSTTAEIRQRIDSLSTEPQARPHSIFGEIDGYDFNRAGSVSARPPSIIEEQGVSCTHRCPQRACDRVKRSQLTNHVCPYFCMGVLVSLLYPSYFASSVSCMCSLSYLIQVQAMYPEQFSRLPFLTLDTS